MRGLGYPLYVNGKLFDEPVTISHVPGSAVGASDRDPSMGGLGRLNGLGQYVSYYPNFPTLGAADAETQAAEASLLKISPLWVVVSTASMVAGIYHGYKRNQSIGWALGWGLLSSMFPYIAMPVALAQGFGKPKAMHANRSRRKRRARARAPKRRASRSRRRRNPKKREEAVYVFMGQIERGTGRGKPSYRWHDGYSLDGNTYPWLTKREAQQEAKREGKKAVFR